MAPAKGSKPEVNPWGWTTAVAPENVEVEHILKAYRVTDFKPCEERRRNCKRNPYCCWGLGERKWVQDAEDDSEVEDNGFREEGEFAGLQNLGATCYVNSLLQLWFHNPILRPAILRWQPNQQIMDPQSYRPVGPIGQLQAMFARMKISKRSKIDPTEFVTSLKLDTGEQQDAQEFSKLFMEVIVKLLTEYADEAVKTSIETAFRGELQNETECTGCKNKTRRQESFSELELGVRKNLGESLDELLKDELLTDSDQYFCSVCQMKKDAIRRTQLLNLPPVLNLQLMRFIFDRETYRKKKVTTSIQFPEVLNMSSRIFGNTPGDIPDDSDSLIYQLTAVLVHNGPSASSGHYVAQIKDLRTGIWHKFNDENVDPVSKTKSQKLVLKEDDAGSGSDTEKKVKTKKAKTGNHSSQGAYMLVYTLEKHIKNPEPDPELLPYLESLVKLEDQVYEEEIQKSKHDKDYENSLKEQRKSEIAMLYPTLQVTEKEKPVKTEDEESDCQPPRRKIARSECNGVSPSSSGQKIVTNNGSNNGDSETNVTKGHTRNTNDDALNVATLAMSIKPSTPTHGTVTVQNKSYSGAVVNGNGIAKDSYSNMDFISADWLQQWLDGNNPPPPIENSMLLCEHGKLSPPAPLTLACLYRIVPSDFADELYKNYDYVGPRFQGLSALCNICVENQCRRLRQLQELEDDYKLFLELNKKLDSELSIFIKTGAIVPDDRLEKLDCCWIGKETLKNWKRGAKDRIEESFKKKESSVGNDVMDEDSDVSPMPYNSELLCLHENLTPNEAQRKLIPLQAWSIISKYFSDAITISALAKRNCTDCINQKKESSEMRNTYKEVAAKQKSKLQDLYHLRNRPDVDNAGVYYVVAQQFVNKWKKFIREPSKYDPAVVINNKGLFCKHGLFMYPLQYLSQAFLPSKEINSEDKTFVLVHDWEWEHIKEYASCDQEIKVTVRISDESGIEIDYTPEHCSDCGMEWLTDTVKKQYEYENEYIYIIRRDWVEPEDSENDDDLFIPLTTCKKKIVVSRDSMPSQNQNSKDRETPTSNKRERKIRDPTAWQGPIGNKETPSSSGVRRSNRSRRQRGEKSYKVASSLTIKELKVMILRDFKALPSDQHLFFGTKELTHGTTTLREEEIPPETKLYLEIDTVNKQEDEPMPTTLETGFQGTLLMGDASPSPDVPEQDNGVQVQTNEAETVLKDETV